MSPTSHNRILQHTTSSGGTSVQQIDDWPRGHIAVVRLRVGNGCALQPSVSWGHVGGEQGIEPPYGDPMLLLRIEGIQCWAGHRASSGGGLLAPKRSQ